MADIVRAREPFSVPLPSGVPLSVSTGDLFYADDGIMAGREHLFGAVVVRSSSAYGRPAPGVDTETADAAPGTRRAPARRDSVDTPAPKGEDEAPASAQPADPATVGKVGAPKGTPKAGGKANA